MRCHKYSRSFGSIDRFDRWAVWRVLASLLPQTALPQASPAARQPGLSIRSLLSFACMSPVHSMNSFRPGLVAVAEFSATLRVRFPFRVPFLSPAGVASRDTYGSRSIALIFIMRVWVGVVWRQRSTRARRLKNSLAIPSHGASQSFPATVLSQSFSSHGASQSFPATVLPRLFSSHGASQSFPATVLPSYFQPRCSLNHFSTMVP